MTKRVYFTDAQGIYAGFRDAGDDYVLGPGETFDAPSESLKVATLSASGWVEGVIPTVATADTLPITQDNIDAELLKSIAQLQLDNANLLKEIATIKAGGES